MEQNPVAPVEGLAVNDSFDFLNTTGGCCMSMDRISLGFPHFTSEETLKLLAV